jgi:probable HAF family extracellular repeat protein
MTRPYAFALSILLVLSLSSLAAAQAYSVTNVGVVFPQALDSNGKVAGVFVGPEKPHQENAFLWTKSGGILNLGTLGGSGNDSAAFGINASGQVVGQANSSPGAPDQAFLWTESAGMIDLGNLGGPSSVANAINASGQVAGQSDLASGFTHAFLWTESGGLQDLGTLSGGQQSGANAINSAGEIAGWANVGSNDYAIVWTQSAGLVKLGINASCGATAFGINDSSEVVGWFNNSSGCTFTSHGFSWSNSSGLTDLGVLPGGKYSFAYAVNFAGQIVGTGDSSTSAVVALLWTAGGKPQDLNTLISSKVPRILVAANAINDAGQIVADATAENGNGHFALLLTPIMSTTLTSSPNPSQRGQAVTFTATVSSIAGAPPNGEQVVFKSGAIVLGSGSLTDGVATLTTASLGVGKNRISATYAGDAIYASSKSPLLTQVVTK